MLDLHGPPDSPDAGEATTYVARGPVDLVALVPYLLGFQPEDSVVLMSIGPRSFHARVDLPRDAGGRAAVVVSLIGAVRRNAVARVAVVVFSDDHEAAEAVVAPLVGALADHQLDIIDVLRADGRRCWPLLDSPCRAGLEYDLSTHPFTADRVLAGQVALASRAELVASIAPRDSPSARADVEAVERHANQLLDRIFDTVVADARTAELFGIDDHDDGHTFALCDQAQWLHGRLASAMAAESGERDGDLPAVDAARVLALVQFKTLRDIALLGLCHTDATSQVRLWRGLIRRAPASLVPGAAGVLAFAAWVAGDGALARCAIDRATQAEPDAGSWVAMLGLVEGMLDAALPPSAWEPLQPDDLPILRARRGFKPGAGSP